MVAPDDPGQPSMDLGLMLRGVEAALEAAAPAAVAAARRP